jgi:hypothetical protein
MSSHAPDFSREPYSGDRLPQVADRSKKNAILRRALTDLRELATVEEDEDGIVDCGTDIDTFVRLAERHVPARVLQLIDGKTGWRCEVDGEGRLVKCITPLDRDEPSEVVDFFGENHMHLSFPKGGFRRSWVASFASCLEDFEGGLKDALMQVQLGWLRGSGA